MMLSRKKETPSPLAPLFHWARTNTGVSLAWRIALINMGGMLLAIIGLLYANSSSDWLVEGELIQLRKQGQIIADTLSKKITTHNVSITSEIDLRDDLDLLTENRPFWLQLYSESGTLIYDNKSMTDARKKLFFAPAQEAWREASWADRVFNIFYFLAEHVPYAVGMLPFDPSRYDAPLAQPDVKMALKGEMAWVAWHSDEGYPILTLAAPVKNGQKVEGFIWVTQTSEDVARVITNMRVELLSNFSLFLLLSVLLSLYLAQKVVLPLQRLSAAAAQAQIVASGKPVIPDYTRRKDEIAELSAALQGMTDALWERLGTIERFAADVSHEIKNPITSMKSALETIDRVSDPERREKLLSILKEDVARLEKLITEIASTTRLEGEMSRQAPEYFNLVEMVSSYVASKTQAGLPLDLHVSTSRLFVHGLPSGILQIIDNLVGNALSFSPEGARVIIRLKEQGKQVALSVEDVGPGIPDGTEEKIFERFYSLRTGPSRSGSHSGLGLSISRQIAQSHGGQLFAGNKRDPATGRVLGACFTLLLPQVPSRKAKKARQS